MARRLVVIDPPERLAGLTLRAESSDLVTTIADVARAIGETREKTERERVAARCVHYNGIHRDHCEAGVEYASVRDASSGPDTARFPCVKIDGLAPCAVRCAKHRAPTPLEIEAKIAERIPGDTGRRCSVCGRNTPYTDWDRCEEHNSLGR